jgi:hypothetical protein
MDVDAVALFEGWAMALPRGSHRDRMVKCRETRRQLLECTRRTADQWRVVISDQ